MDAGFTAIARGQHVKLYRIGLSNNHEHSLFSYSFTEGASAILVGRLHYRHQRINDIVDLEDQALFENAKVNGAALALALYLKFGKAGMVRLEGDFSLIVYDQSNKRLIGARDPMGGFPLFWTDDVNSIAFSTSVASLLQQLSCKKLNLEYIAEYLTAPAPFNELASEHCVYEGIHRVLPGHIVEALLQDETVRQMRYWDWMSNIATVDPKTVPTDYQETLRMAVRERMTGLTWAHLSGGMDSTAVALLAGEHVADHQSPHPLHTISLVYRELEELSQETSYLQIALKSHPSIVTHFVPADMLLDFDSFKNPPRHGEPYPGLCRLALDRATIDCAIENDADTLLTGIGADEMLDTQPYHITDLLRRGRLYRAWSEAVRWAEADNYSPWEVLNVFGLAHIFSNMAGGAFRIHRKQVNLVNPKRSVIASWISHEFAREFDLDERARAKNRNVFQRYSRLTALSAALSSIESRNGDFNRWHVAVPHGVMIAHPFLDPRVLSLGLGIVLTIKAVPGKMKPVLAEAMAKVLPEAIRSRRRKGHFNEVYYRGLSKNLGELEVLLQQADLCGLKLFDLSELSKCLQQAALGGVGVRACQQLNSTLSLIKWCFLQNRLWKNEPHKQNQLA